VAERGEARDVLDVLGEQQILREIEHEQRLHAVIREALPGFREDEIPKPARMAEHFLTGGRRENGGHVVFPTTRVAAGTMAGPHSRDPARV
jgi:hypothetical protein